MRQSANMAGSFDEALIRMIIILSRRLKKKLIPSRTATSDKHQNTRHINITNMKISMNRQRPCDSQGMRKVSVGTKAVWEPGPYQWSRKKRYWIRRFSRKKTKPSTAMKVTFFPTKSQRNGSIVYSSPGRTGRVKTRASGTNG